MKKLIIFSAIISLYFCSCAQNTSSDKNQSNGPKIEFVKTIHDYGTIKKGSDGGCEFHFKNTGNEPLILSNVTSSCGCTIPTWPKDPVLPGQSGKINVMYDTKRIGNISKTIKVMSNAITDAIVLEIKGNVVE